MQYIFLKTQNHAHKSTNFTKCKLCQKKKKISNQFRKTYSSSERQGQTNNRFTQAIQTAQQVKALAS